jgi:hypothetical protein
MSAPVRTLLVEGGRRNLLPTIEEVGRFLAAIGRIVSYQRPSAVGDAPTWEIEVSLDREAVARLPANGMEAYRDYTLSAFAWSPSTVPITMTLGIAGGGECVLRSHTLGEKHERYEASHRFDVVPASLCATIAFRHAHGPRSCVARAFLAFPVLEQGLFASSPIDPGAERGSETVSLSREGKFFVGEQGTVSVTFIPSWSGSDLSPQMSPTLLSCYDESNGNAVKIFANGERWGRLSAQIVVNGNQSVLESGVSPLRDGVHSVALRWAGGIADLLVDGWPVRSVTGIALPVESSLGQRVYIGCDPRGKDTGLFGGILGIVSYPDWRTDRALQASLFQDYPDLFMQFRNVQASVPDEPLRNLAPGSWTTPFVRQLLRHPDLWQAMPPAWLRDSQTTTEEAFRDEIARSLGATGVEAIPEAHSAQGRADLLMRVAEQRFYLECKVWGRHDYADVPLKPLKYFATTDRVGAVLMINATRSRIGARYRANVLRSATQCTRIVDTPFGESLPDHFVSVHGAGASQVEILHIVFDRYGPFAVAADKSEA